MKVVNEESASNSADKSVVVECPDGKVAIGGGATLDGGAGFVALSESRMVQPPLVFAPGWRAEAIEVNGGTDDSWTVTAFANCFTMD